MLEELRAWPRHTLAWLSKKSELAKAIGYVLTRLMTLTQYYAEGRSARRQ